MTTEVEENMAFRVKVTKVDKQEVSLEVVKDNVVLKQVNKPYSSLQALYGMISKWYPSKAFLKPADPNGWFAPNLEGTQQSLQKFFDTIVKELGEDSFPVKAYFRLYDLKGKVIILTGGSSGIGKQNAYQLAEMGAHLILGNRNEAKSMPIIADIKKVTGNPNVEFMQLDISELPSVRKFVENYKARNLPIHVLINNAGNFSPEGLTDYGVDLTFACNHVGPFLLTFGLLNVLKNTENSRIVFVSSKIALKMKELSFERVRSVIPQTLTNPMEAYALSKLANILAVRSLATQFAETNCHVATYALHPGVVSTDVYRNYPKFVQNTISSFMLNEEEGSWMTLYCSVAEECAKETGNYYNYEKSCAPADPQPVLAEDAELRKRCWEESEIMCGLRPAKS